MNKAVRIAELKARLSEYLREVRRGRTLTILDRETPVARLVPYDAAPPLIVRRPNPGTPPLGEVPMPPPLDLPVDAVALLLEERRTGR
jgi:prevent-host-death family protein